MVNFYEEYGFDKGPLSVSDLQLFEEMAELLGDSQDRGNLSFVQGLAEDRRLIIRQLLAEVSRFRSDYTWEW